MTEPPAAPVPRQRHRASRLVAAGLALALIAVLLALGTWQLQRRTWKLALIARVEERVHAPPVPVPGPDLWPRIDAQGFEYRHVQATGTWLPDRSAWVTASTELGTGYWLLTPLRQADGTVLWVNRGYVSQEARARGQAASGAAPATVTGLLRLNEPRGAFLRRNDPGADRWYSRDVRALSERRGIDHAAPFFIDADAAPAAAGASADEPVGGLTVVSFANNHLMYALTWYTLALLTAWAAWSALRTTGPFRERDHASAD